MLSCGKLILFVLGFTFFCFDGVAEMQTNTVVRRERLKPFMDGEWGYISENSGATLSRYDGQGGTVSRRRRTLPCNACRQSFSTLLTTMI